MWTASYHGHFPVRTQTNLCPRLHNASVKQHDYWENGMFPYSNPEWYILQEKCLAPRTESKEIISPQIKLIQVIVVVIVIFLSCFILLLVYSCDFGIKPWKLFLVFYPHRWVDDLICSLCKKSPALTFHPNKNPYVLFHH